MNTMREFKVKLSHVCMSRMIQKKFVGLVDTSKLLHNLWAFWEKFSVPEPSKALFRPINLFESLKKITYALAQQIGEAVKLAMNDRDT